jgi:glycosyltransferase involved in cell wall biosynthesis
VRTLHVVVPAEVDDPARPSGGNEYDRRLCRELRSLGWSIREHAVPGFWARRPDAGAFAALQQSLQQIPADALVMLDGLIASSAPEVVVPQTRRLRLVVLVHMPFGHLPSENGVRLRERDVLSAAGEVVATSGWARRRLIELYDLPAHRVHVAEPGVDAAQIAGGTAAGGALLCVAGVTFEKGHDVLLDALGSIPDRAWHCVCVGSLDRDPAFVETVRRRSLEARLGDRVSFTGPRTRAELERHYAAADLLVLASRVETYGMVVTEALAHGLPVIATETGGLPEALGEGIDGSRPGVLVAPEDPVALGAALRDWLDDAELRARLRRAAGERRESLPGWSRTALTVADVLTAASR